MQPDIILYFWFKLHSAFLYPLSIFCLFCLFPRILLTLLDSSKLKELADDNFTFDENGRQFSRKVENTVGKGGRRNCSLRSAKSLDLANQKLYRFHKTGKFLRTRLIMFLRMDHEYGL